MPVEEMNKKISEFRHKALTEGLTKEDYYELKNLLSSINDKMLNDINYQIIRLQLINLLKLIYFHKDGVLNYNNKTVNYVKKRALILPIVLADADFNFGRFTGPNGYMILCPYHSEKTPSFRVKDYENIFNCFGCGSSGNVYDYLKLTHNMEFLEAIDFLMKVYMWKKEDADEKNHDLIIKYQKAIISPEFSELLKRCQERMQRKDLDFMPHSSTLTKDFFNDRFLMIERMKKGLADPDYIERDPAVNIKFTSKEVWAATDSTEIKELRRKRILAMDPEEFRKELNRNLKSNPEEDDESLLPF
ncbi:MAG: hypothetical protein IJO33_04970 [Bacilli bacterium]|nr:hypothetical protein [Bacilli bacterium]